ncbi:exocyst complex component 2-like [Mya arenaria]|uniref:exocyst complex component 2-like n=1 Tax=Mya arenaria TaxID=6604 RepID=UPI0022E09C5D|nr:exocyst complex component 2-like [Mya arenaria]XP_052817554.1 exocyst complex component 2-like [Mya arenaria]XP_052817555.1 exocyst complex component 2-like [Mya arenaria]XP_052817556.1 exocyst complex component 2-like [Mya arenaria]
MGPQPVVTGVSPREGPPGTRVTIRGEHLGLDQKDLIGLKICGVDCLLSADWKSSSKVIARTGPGKGKGDITITTRSGGNGTCTVGFRGFFVQIGPLQESAVWVDETQTVLNQLGRRGNQAPLASRDGEDPLGLSDEGNHAKSEDEMLELFPECSGSMSLENFSPDWYLLENHQAASFEDLKMGLSNMRLSARSRSEGPTAFVKANIGTILDCLESLSSMYEKFSEDDIQRECISSYAVSLMQAKSCADGLFQEVLGRKDQADQTRNALNVLTRFRFLFYLPLNMERNIQKGDYNMVINDYIRARALFAKTEVKIFKKVYGEVEESMQAFCKMLRQKLLKLPNTLHEQKKLIGYLSSLESKGNVGWECLSNMESWLRNLLVDCQKRHTQSTLTPGGRYGPPQKVLFVEELTELMTAHFPHFWKLGQAYVTGSLAHREDGKSLKTESTSNKFKEMVSSTIKYFSNLVRGAFLPASLETLGAEERRQYGVWSETHNVSGSWLPHCVRYVRSCVSGLSGLELPGDSTELLQELAFDMRTQCMEVLLTQATHDVGGLVTKETWVLERDDESGGTTQLPALFENIVNEAVQHLHEVVVQNKPAETEMFSQRTVQKEATTMCGRLLGAFAPCIEKLAFEEPPADLTSTLAKNAENKRRSYLDDPTDESIPPKEQRILIMLSNCRHTESTLLPRLVDNLARHGYLEMSKVLQTCKHTYSGLCDRLFEAYVEEKANPIVGVMEPHMYRGHFNWCTCKHPSDVRNYLKEVLMGLIEVHAEVYSILPSYVRPVMTRVIEAVAEEISRLVQCVPEFGTNGAIQAKLEILCLQETVKEYKTNVTDSSFAEALDYLPDIDQDSQKRVVELQEKFRAQMKLQLLCFHPTQHS